MNPSNTIPTSGLPTMPPAQNQYARPSTEFSDELDLVDIIVFFWKWRLLIAISVVAGAVLGATIATYKSHRTQSLPVNGVWNVTMSLTDLDQGSTDQILPALKSRLATLVFNAGVNGSSPQPVPAALAAWHSKLTTSAPAGTPAALEFSGGTALFRIEAPDNIDAPLLSKTLLITINQAIDRYNQEVVVPFQRLESDQDAAVFGLAKLTFDVIRLFENKSTTPSAINLEILKALVNNKSGPIAKNGIYFLLAGVPDNLPEKNMLLTDYQKLEALAAKDQKRHEEYLKSYPPNGPTLALKFDQALSQTFIDNVVKPTHLNPLIYLLMGGFLGGSLATVLALAWQFIRTNSARFRQGLE